MLCKISTQFVSSLKEKIPPKYNKLRNGERNNPDHQVA
jgi:hypothetical protein